MDRVKAFYNRVLKSIISYTRRSVYFTGYYFRKIRFCPKLVLNLQDKTEDMCEMIENHALISELSEVELSEVIEI